ncbi:ribonuclease HII [Alkalibacillus salilacus]|uniref:Ribonuclease HII n=1 Tax=Alkalibacillus salilacus TaxID=284582 RepID=A0ABT9VDR2_9BACI|nr:ribonuclease HII [Alkalibacillus salilacus]
MDVSQLTIRYIKTMVESDEVTSDQLALLRKDARSGVQKLINQYDKRVEKQEQLKVKFEKMKEFEDAQYSDGYRFIAGVDEVGRGPLAGPVVAASVILDPFDSTLIGIDDSKQLSETKREQYYETIMDNAIAVGVGIVNANRIDQINIYQAAKQAMAEAINDMHQEPDYCLLDAMTLEELSCPQQSLVKGDQRSISIAAASVIAKVTRDNMMVEAAHTYPDFEFDRNMGYGTTNHLQALSEHGPTPLHRRSFNPVTSYV